MAASHPPRACIAGVAETPLGKVLDHSEYSMVAVAAAEALAEAGLRLKSLSRELAAMRDEGLLDIRGKTIALPHPERLKEFYDYFVP